MASSTKSLPTAREIPEIAIDACFLTEFPNTSLAIYLRGLLREWQDYESPPRILLLLPRPPEGAMEPLLSASNIQLAFPDTPLSPASRFLSLTLWHQWAIPRLLRKHRPHIYFSPFHFTPLLSWNIPVVTTIHDLCFLSEKQFSLGSLTHRMQVVTACLGARRLICVSHYTSAILHHWQKSSARKSVVVQNGYDGETMPLEKAVSLLKEKFQGVVPNGYFLWIGHPSPRKNTEGLLDSFRLYRQETSDDRVLVMVAPEHTHPGLRALAAERGIGDKLTLSSSLSDTQRNALYRCATALVFPSRCEGFGYPVLEAMVQGCPPISLRNSPSLEIVGNLFPLPENLEPEEFCKIMVLAASMTDMERQDLADRLIQKSSRFSLRTMARKTLEAIRMAG